MPSAPNDTNKQTNNRLDSVDLAPSTPAPAQSSSPAPDIDWPLVAAFREQVSGFYAANKHKCCRVHYEDLMDAQSGFASWRYLVQSELDVGRASELAQRSLAWRAEAAVEAIRPDDFPKEFWHWGCMLPMGRQAGTGKHVLYVIGRNYRKPQALLKPTIYRWLHYILRSLEARVKHNMETFFLVFDTTSTGLANMDTELVRMLINMVEYYPATVSDIQVVGVPFIVRPIVRLIISWLPSYLSRVCRCGSSEELIWAQLEPDLIPPECGGTSAEPYRLAPGEAPWLAEWPPADGAMTKAMEASFAWCVSAETRAQRRQRQLEFESKSAA